MGSFWRATAGYLFNQAKVTESAVNQALVGNFLGRVPTHRGSVGVSYANPRIGTLAASGLFFGRQFDDDFNVRRKS